MKQRGSDDAESLVVVARAVKTRGLKGELVAELLTDFPDRFADISSLIAVSSKGQRELVELERYWFHQERVVLKLAGFDSIEAASRFIDYEFAVPEADRVELEPGYFYNWELEDCVVETNEGAQIGKVSEVMRLGGEIDMLAVEDVTGKRRLIPMVESIVLEVDVAGRKIRIDPPEGLLEL
jgi:16S rRNA processing protein RimM